MRSTFEQEDLEVLRTLIQEELRKIVPQNNEPKYLTRAEACELLKISPPTLHAWMGKGLLRKTKIGNRVLIEDAEIQRMILKMKNH